MKKEAYQAYTAKRAGKSHLVRDCICAFFVGGAICLLGECALQAFIHCGVDAEAAKKWVPIVLIFLSCLLTGIGWYDSLAKKAGAGTLVPITGFANAMCSPAVDNNSEGYVLGVGAKMFNIAGPVIAYGAAASFVYGLIYWIVQTFRA